jgi:ABC-type multidrug transport system permease subunit
MWSPSNRVLGVLATLGGLCILVAAVPARWLGSVPDDSYVFDPPRFSALWFERVVVPALAVVATVLILIGLLALFRRDRAWMARWQRWFAVVGVVGAAVGTLATLLLASAEAETSAISTNVLLGTGFALLASLLVPPGLLGWGGGYLRADRPGLGAALAGGPLLACLAIAVNVGAGVAFGPVGALPVVLPVVLAVVVVGYDLWGRTG